MTSILLLMTALVSGGGDDKATIRGRALDFSRVDAAVVEGIRKGIYPGAVVVIGTSERILHAQRYGRFLQEWSAIYERFGVPAELGLAQAVIESGLLLQRSLADGVECEADFHILATIEALEFAAQTGLRRK